MLRVRRKKQGVARLFRFLLETSENQKLISRTTGRLLMAIRDEAVRATLSDVSRPPLQHHRELDGMNWDWVNPKLFYFA
jgi:hypothetical protein